MQHSPIVKQYGVSFLKGKLESVRLVIEQISKPFQSRIKFRWGRKGKRGLKGRRIINMRDFSKRRGQGLRCKFNGEMILMEMVTIVHVVERNGRFAENVKVKCMCFSEERSDV